VGFFLGLWTGLSRFQAPAADAFDAFQNPRIAPGTASTRMACDAFFLIGGLFGIEITCQVVDHFQYPTDLHEFVIAAVEMGSSTEPEPAWP